MDAELLSAVRKTWWYELCGGDFVEVVKAGAGDWGGLVCRIGGRGRGELSSKVRLYRHEPVAL